MIKIDRFLQKFNLKHKTVRVTYITDNTGKYTSIFSIIKIR